MKLEDLKTLTIGIESEFTVGASTPGSNQPCATFYSLRTDDFDNQQTARLAAARFRASEEMYQALRTIVAAMDENREMNQRAYHGAIVGEPEWVAQARAALALADNTNETQK